MTAEQQERQAAFDEWLDDPGHELVIDAMVNAEHRHRRPRPVRSHRRRP
jgi:hypothetical protein